MRSNMQIIQDSYEASSNGNPAEIVADLAEDAQWVEMAGFPCAGTYVGAKAVIEGVFNRLGTEWEGYTCKPESFYDAGETIIVTGWYSGIYRKTGKSFQARVTHIWQLNAGKIQRFEQFTDTLLVAKAMW